MKVHSYKEIDSPYWVAAFGMSNLSAGNLAQIEAWCYNNFGPGNLTQIEAWCYNNFGPGLGEYRLDNSPFIHRWVNDIKYGEIRFSNECDLMWFVAKWA
jgi:hypothetical protein